MPKVEIADDNGDEISEITVPIPFYIRVHLEEGTKRYRVRLIDDNGRVRGQYQGSTDRRFLELHVPLIKLPKPGQLRIVVEESTGQGELLQQHQVSIHYLPYTEPKEMPIDERAEPSLSSSEQNDLGLNGREVVSEADQLAEQAEEESRLDMVDEEPEFEDESLENKKVENESEGSDSQVEVQTDTIKTSSLTEDETEYLFRREKAIQDGIVVFKDIESSIQSPEEE
ncbi:MAG: hypothetical protein ACTSPG_03590 [Candidatus Hodarchaeales archaeon]